MPANMNPYVRLTINKRLHPLQVLTTVSTAFEDHNDLSHQKPDAGSSKRASRTLQDILPEIQPGCVQWQYACGGQQQYVLSQQLYRAAMAQQGCPADLDPSSCTVGRW